MTKEEIISITRLAAKVDGLSESTVTKELLHAEVDRIDQALRDHCEYSKAASEVETNRINEIHNADAKALSVANTEASERAATLAANVDKVATTVQQLVETTRLAAEKSQAELINPIIARLNEIEKKQYENQGKEFYSDPMMTKLVERMESVATAMSEGKGRSGLSAPLLMMIAGLCGGILVYIVQMLMVVR